MSDLAERQYPNQNKMYYLIDITLHFEYFSQELKEIFEGFRVLLPVKLQMFGAYQITLSNAVISCEDFRVAIDKLTFQCQFGNVNELTRQLNYKKCKRFKVILFVKG